MTLVFLRRLLVLAALLGCARWAGAASDPQFVAFLEDRIEPGARIAFQKTGAGWKSFCPPDHRIIVPESCRPAVSEVPSRWNVVYRNEAKGSIETIPYRPRFLADVGLFRIEDADSVPTVGEQDNEFAGHIPHSGYRPLVMLANPNYSDPQAWSPLDVNEVDPGELWRPFVNAAGDATACSVDGDGEEKAVSWDYQLKHVRVFQAFASKQSGARLVALHLDPTLNNCDGPRARAWSTFWFLIDGKSRVKPLEFLTRNSAAGRGYVAKMLDWGDYDSDGQSEMIFWVEGNNEDGYALFYDSFSKEVTFSWIYYQ